MPGGELHFSGRKRKEEVYLDEETERKLEKVGSDILRILYLDNPPEPQKSIGAGVAPMRNFAGV